MFCLVIKQDYSFFIDCSNFIAATFLYSLIPFLTDIKRIFHSARQTTDFFSVLAPWLVFQLNQSQILLRYVVRCNDDSV